MGLSETGDIGLIDTHTLFENGPLRVDAHMWEDNDAGKLDEADCYSDEDRAAFEREEWEYVGMEVSVFWQGVEIGNDALWGIEDGNMAGQQVSGWRWGAGSKETREDGTDVYMGGTPLWEVAGQAIGDALTWLGGLVGEPAARQGLDTAVRWAARTDEPGLGIDERAQFCGFDGITDEEIATVLAGDCEDDVRARFVKEQASRA